MFTFQLTPDNTLQHSQTIVLPGNALSSITNVSESTTKLIVSIDNVHKSGSTTDRREESEELFNSLCSYTFQTHQAITGASFDVVEGREDADNGNVLGKLGNLLYTLENLRKRESDVREEGRLGEEAFK